MRGEWSVVLPLVQEELSAVTERKRQLKEELSAVREELTQWQTKYRYLYIEVYTASAYDVV